MTAGKTEEKGKEGVSAQKTKTAPEASPTGEKGGAHKRMLSVNFSGKELLEGRIFDTTSAEEAKANGILEEKRNYGPLTIITGEKELLLLVEAELEKMKVGEKRIVKLSPKDAFGERDARLIRVVPLQVFHNQKMNPIPGLVIRAGNAVGKVQSVSGGRVRVDFNHPLAGRELEYGIKVEKEITGKKEVAEELFKKYYSFVPGAKKETVGEKLVVSLEEKTLKNLENINKAVQGVGKNFGVEVEFVAAKAEKVLETPAPASEKVVAKTDAKEKKAKIK